MIAPRLTRRAALAALGVLTAPYLIRVRGALAQPGARFRGVQVDVSPLRRRTGDPTAEWVQQELPRALAQALGGYLSPGERGGATLVARIDDIYLGPNSGGTGPWGASQDTINGVLLIHGPHGGLVSGTPVRAIAFYHPNPFDQPLRVESNHWRVTALAQAFAQWAPRELGL
jgi:hypothetical protein